MTGGLLLVASSAGAAAASSRALAASSARSRFDLGQATGQVGLHGLPRGRDLGLDVAQASSMLAICSVE